MAEIAIIATVAAGQVIQGIQGMQAGRAQAKVAGQKAEAERRSATVAEAAERTRARRFRSAQLARFSKAGVLMTGTPLDVLEETAVQQEKDALAIRYGGEVRSARALSEGRLAKQRGKQAMIGGVTKAASAVAGSTLLER
jgi:hypothetical protein